MTAGRVRNAGTIRTAWGQAVPALAVALLLPTTVPAQTPACELLKEQLAGRFEANGVRGFSLEAVPADDPVASGVRVVGNCEAGRYQVLMRRGAAVPAGADAGASRPGNAPPAAAATPGRAPAVPAPAPGTTAPKVAPKAATAAAAAPEVDPAVAWQRAVDRALARLAQLEFGFEAPAAIAVGDTTTVRLAPLGATGGSWLQAALKGPPGDDGSAPAVPVAVDAQLTGTNARISAVGGAPGAGASAPARWEWRVQPMAAGRIDLALTLSARFTGGDGDAPRVVRRFEHAIEVSAPFVQQAAAWVSGVWGWLAGALVLLLGLGGALWAWYARRSAYDEAGLPRGPRLS